MLTHRSPKEPAVPSFLRCADTGEGAGDFTPLPYEAASHRSRRF